MNILQRVISQKNILLQYYHSARWCWCKKVQKISPQTWDKYFFSQCLIKNSSLLWPFMVQKFCKNSISRAKSRKIGIPVIEITYFLQKIPQSYKFPWVNTNTNKYTYRFNTSFVFFNWNFFINTIITFFFMQATDITAHLNIINGNFISFLSMENGCKPGYKFEIDKLYSNEITQQSQKEPGIVLDSRKNMIINCHRLSRFLLTKKNAVKSWLSTNHLS